MPADEIPDDEDAIRLILGGQTAQRILYDALLEHAAAEQRVLVAMLRRDWDERFQEASLVGPDLIARIRGVPVADAEPVEAQPSAAAIPSWLESLGDDGSNRTMEVVAAFSDRALVCRALVPWKSDLAPVYDFFCGCVESEDLHRGLLAQFSRLI